MTTYQVNELFDSLQGEGYWTGIPATFIRLQGCTVGCPWCDSGPMADQIWGRFTNGLTRNTWGKGGVQMTADEIVDQVGADHVVITGGEPTLYNLDDLIKTIHKRLRGSVVQLETSGQQWLKGDVTPDWITWSPKEMLGWKAPVEFYRRAREIKFVVEPTLTFETVYAAYAFASSLGNYEVFMMMMPEGCPPSKENVKLATEYTWQLVNLGVVTARFADRLQYRLGIR